MLDPVRDGADRAEVETAILAVFEVIDGWLKIEPETITITVNGNNTSKVYNGKEQRFGGTFTASSDDPGFDADKFQYNGKKSASGTDVGDYTTDPVETSCSYNDSNYKVVWKMGDPVRLTITPAELTVRVIGHNKIVKFNGKEQQAEGYDLSCDSELYDAGKVKFSGEAVAKGIEAGTYPMGLEASQFSYNDTNVQAEFKVTDGWLVIDPEDAPEQTFDITYDLNGGTYNGKKDNIVESYPYGTVLSIHEAPVREGYTFLYWKGSQYDPGDPYTVIEDHTFVVQWESTDSPSPDPDEPDTPDKSDKPGTGDDTRPGFWWILLILGFMGLCTTGFIFLRRRKHLRNNVSKTDRKE